jgi:hypothetical protein
MPSILHSSDIRQIKTTFQVYTKEKKKQFLQSFFVSLQFPVISILHPKSLFLLAESLRKYPFVWRVYDRNGVTETPLADPEKK